MESTNEDDIVIVVEDEEIVCNRKQLIERSPYFDAMFNGNFTERNQKVITLKEVKYNGLKNIMRLLQNTYDHIESEDVFDTLEGASMLQFDAVKNRCVQLLQDNITNGNCLRTWFLCDKLDVRPLSEKAKCKSLVEFNAIRENDSVLSLNIEQLHAYLSSTLLHCDNELDVFETALKWWYEFCRKGDDGDKNHTDYLMVFLRCLDFGRMSKKDVEDLSLTCPDMRNDPYVAGVLAALSSLVDDAPVSDETVEARTAVSLYANLRKRCAIYSPCVVCTEYNDRSNEPKRRKYMNCNCVKTINVHRFNERTKGMEKLVDLGMHNEDRCNATLEGYQMVPYKEKLLFFGGEYQYGTADWNKSVWAYDTFKEDWVLVTTLPKERRHFKTVVVDDKLYVIGGTGKYRIIQDDMMCYDLKKGAWEDVVKLPQVLYNIKCCSFKNTVFIMSDNMRNKFGYLYNKQLKLWQRLSIEDLNGDVPEDVDNFIMFSMGNILYVKGTHLIKLELVAERLVVRECVNFTSCAVFPDELGYCRTDGNVYMFSLHKSERDFTNIYLLEKWNLKTDKSKLLLQINDSVDVRWNIYSGCFAFLHYESVKDSKCISDFVF